LVFLTGRGGGETPCYRRSMAGERDTEVICVHCGKSFRAEVLGPETGQAGVKCPHCRLFMPLERTERPDAAA
jgi:DNA-directed RNA polymerase subunit RPC12/RpoP